MTSDNMSGSIDKARTMEQPLYVCFVYIRRAFDKCQCFINYYSEFLMGKLLKYSGLLVCYQML